MYTITGRVYKKTMTTELISKAGESFYKREIIIETDGKYKDYIPLELFNNVCSLADNFEIGDIVTVSFNMRGRLWNEKALLSLSLVGISYTIPPQGVKEVSKEPEDYSQEIEESNELPF